MSNKTMDNVISPADNHMIPLAIRIKQEKLRRTNDTINRTKAMKKDAHIRSMPALKRSLLVMVAVCCFGNSAKKVTIAVVDTEITKHAIFIAIFKSASWVWNSNFWCTASVPSCSVIIWVLEIWLLTYKRTIFI